MKLKEIAEAKKNNKGPKGTYAGYHFDNADLKKVRAWAKKHEIPNRVPHEKMHTTLLYSRKHCPDYQPLGTLNPPMKLKFGEFEIWPTQDKKHALIVRLDAPQMIDRHNKLMKEHGATYDYDEYKPHITLSYDVGEDFDKSTLEDIKDDVPEIKAVEEYEEELVLDWQNKD